MEIFYSKETEGNVCRLDQEESMHCIKVLRHRRGDSISVIDGKGNLLQCRLTDDSPKGAEAEITGITGDWGGHPYRLHMAVCPTKNNDRYEWFLEKACEIGVDTVFPVIGEHSERKIFKTDRAARILISAAKQSLKGAVPEIDGTMSVRDFITKYGKDATGDDGSRKVIRLVAYCFDDDARPRISIKEALKQELSSGGSSEKPDIYIMIGPEGDFSKEEALLAAGQGFIPVHLGTSRLRTETAAVMAAAAVYLNFME